MNEPELNILIENLETRADLSIAEFEGVLQALNLLLPDAIPSETSAQSLDTTDGAIAVAVTAYPGWDINIHGRATPRQGHWQCSLRENDDRDNDAAIGLGKSMRAGQSVLAAVMRLSMIRNKVP